MKWGGTIFAILLLSLTQLSADINVSVNWDQVVAVSSPGLMGVNLWKGIDPAVAGDASFQNRLDQIAPRLIRLHAWEMLNESSSSGQGWYISSCICWDENKIVSVLNQYQDQISSPEHIVMINIPGWPGQIGSGKLSSDKYDDYAAFCAELVDIVNVRNQFNVRYWTPFNERDDLYYGDIGALATIYNQCAAAMKAVDSSIQLCGPDWMRNDRISEIDAFVSLTTSNLDAFTYHQYGGGNSEASYSEIYDWVSNHTWPAQSIRNVLNNHGLSSIPLWLTEHNVFWSWDLDQNRGIMRSRYGAVYHALLLKLLAADGFVDGTTIWNDFDGTYGQIDPWSDSLRPSGYLLALHKQYMVGNVVNTSSDQPGDVEVFAVASTGRRGCLLINRSDANHVVNINFNGWVPSSSTYSEHKVTDSYSVTNKIVDGDFGQDVTIEAHSLLLISVSVSALVPPDELQAQATPTLQIELSWRDNSSDPNEDGFIIQRKPFASVDDWHQIDELGPDTTSYTDTELLYGNVVYTYRVGAVSGGQ